MGGYLRKANLRVLQVLCLLKITAMCDPDAGDSADGCDSCNLTGLIIQISISMGLHMDPSHFSKVSPTIAHLGECCLVSLSLWTPIDPWSWLCLPLCLWSVRIPTFCSSDTLCPMTCCHPARSSTFTIDESSCDG